MSGFARKFWISNSCTCPYSPTHAPQNVHGIDELARRLTDPHEQAGGERDRQSAGRLDHAQPNCWVLVRGTVVHLARFREPGTGRLQHQPHRPRHWSQPAQIRPGQYPRIEVGYQTGLFEHGDCRRPQVGRGVVVPASSSQRRAPGQRVSGVSPRVNSASAQPAAAPARAIATTSVRLRYGSWPERRRAGWVGRESAVVAAVTAQPGQRDEHLGRKVTTPGRPASRSPASRIRPAMCCSSVSSSPRAASSAIASARLMLAPRSARRIARAISRPVDMPPRYAAPAAPGRPEPKQPPGGWDHRVMRITVLAGGYGGATFLAGLRTAVGDGGDLAAVVNTADDIRIHGLAVTGPRHGDVHLGGGLDRERGWGALTKRSAPTRNWPPTACPPGSASATGTSRPT